jgi:hypothetical protein
MLAGREAIYFASLRKQTRRHSRSLKASAKDARFGMTM